VITMLNVDTSGLPDTPYNLWVRGELEEHVDAPEGSRIEIIGGEVVVSAAPSFQHNTIVEDIERILADAQRDRPDFPWVKSSGTALTLVGVGDGFVPDLMVLDRETYMAARLAKVRSLVPDQVELVVEVTSSSNANVDREPGRKHRGNKWNGYAAAEIPYYLLVDRCPKRACTTLYSIPDQSTAAYLHAESWEFGETVHLPEPFDIEINTSLWWRWDE
jgi:Uma2 family endonuclease